VFDELFLWQNLAATKCSSQVCVTFKTLSIKIMLSSDKVHCANNGLSEIKLSSNQRNVYSGIHLTLSYEVMQPSRSVYSRAWSSDGFFLCQANSRFLQRIAKYFFSGIEGP